MAEAGADDLFLIAGDADSPLGGGAARQERYADYLVTQMCFDADACARW